MKHQHVILPRSGARATVSPKASPELLEALDNLCMKAREALQSNKSIIQQNKSTMSINLTDIYECVSCGKQVTHGQKSLQKDGIYTNHVCPACGCDDFYNLTQEEREKDKTEWEARYTAAKKTYKWLANEQGSVDDIRGHLRHCTQDLEYFLISLEAEKRKQNRGSVIKLIERAISKLKANVAPAVKRIHFEDNGQDFLYWEVDANNKVVSAHPFQTDIWRGTQVISEPTPGEELLVKGEYGAMTLRHKVEKVEEIQQTGKEVTP